MLRELVSPLVESGKFTNIKPHTIANASIATHIKTHQLKLKHLITLSAIHHQRHPKAHGCRPSTLTAPP